jgi:hypothetical protein
MKGSFRLASSVATIRHSIALLAVTPAGSEIVMLMASSSPASAIARSRSSGKVDA